MSNELAMDGGPKVRTRPYPPWPYFFGDEMQEVQKVLEEGKVNYWTGRRGMEFQDGFARYCGAKHGVAMTCINPNVLDGAGRTDLQVRPFRGAWLDKPRFRNLTNGDAQHAVLYFRLSVYWTDLEIRPTVEIRNQRGNLELVAGFLA
jgi:hypothetical protein